MRFDIPFLVYDPADFVMPKGSNKFHEIVNAALHRAHIRTRCAEAQNWRCCYCRKVMDHENGKWRSVTLEHILPVSKGGSDDYDNSAAACKRCNNNRSNYDIDENGKYEKPPKQPKIPKLLSPAKTEKRFVHVMIRARQIQAEGGNVEKWLANINFIVNHESLLARFWNELKEEQEG